MSFIIKHNIKQIYFSFKTLNRGEQGETEPNGSNDNRDKKDNLQ